MKPCSSHLFYSSDTPQTYKWNKTCVITFVQSSSHNSFPVLNCMHNAQIIRTSVALHIFHWGWKGSMKLCIFWLLGMTLIFYLRKVTRVYKKAHILNIIRFRENEKNIELNHKSNFCSSALTSLFLNSSLKQPVILILKAILKKNSLPGSIVWMKWTIITLYLLSTHRII